MRTKTLLQLTREAEHLGEIARLIGVFVSHRTELLAAADLLELALNTAGLTPRYPRPAAALALTLKLGLLAKTRDVVRLTTLGKRFIENREGDSLDLNHIQCRLLLGLLMDDREFGAEIARLGRVMQRDASGSFRVRALTVMEIGAKDLAQLLQQLGFLRYEDPMLVVNETFDEMLTLEVARFAALSEEDLWKMLEARRMRAREIEEKVLIEEQLRLRRLGRDDLAELAFRISAKDVGAGYDIHSFDQDGSTRFIEVKSSCGDVLRFEWSLGERNRAQESAGQYWIYFVPLAHALPQPNFCPVVMIQDPVGRILGGDLIESASSFVVNERKARRLYSRSLFSPTKRVIDW